MLLACIKKDSINKISDSLFNALKEYSIEITNQHSNWSGRVHNEGLNDCLDPIELFKILPGNGQKYSLLLLLPYEKACKKPLGESMSVQKVRYS